VPADKERGSTSEKKEAMIREESSFNEGIGPGSYRVWEEKKSPPGTGKIASQLIKKKKTED